MSKQNVLAKVFVAAPHQRVDKNFRENILFTHRGLSGPAILQISSYWKPGTPISIDLLPDEDVLGLLTAEQSSDIGLANLLSRHLPKRFAEVWCELFAASRPLKQYNSAELTEIAERITRTKWSSTARRALCAAERCGSGRLLSLRSTTRNCTG